MTDRPFVSFIIPARNEAAGIGACLDAVAGLNYDRESYEWIVVDNGSLDDTLKIAGAKGARTFLSPGGTVAGVRNFGVEKARGDLIAFIDADCVIDRDWLKNALGHLEDPAVACVGSHPEIPKKSTWVQRSWSVQSRGGAAVEEVDWLPSMNILVRKNAFTEVGGFNESLVTCEDVDLCYRLKDRRYRIVSDRAVKSVHYGEAKTPREFFLKERWRGRSNLQGLLAHGIYLRELPSLALPVLYLALIVLLPAAAVYGFLSGASLPLFTILAVLLLLPLVMALRAALRARAGSSVAALSVLYFLYAVARAVALLPGRRARVKDAAT